MGMQDSAFAICFLISIARTNLVHVIFLCACLLPLVRMLLGLCIAAVITILHTVDDHAPIVVPFVFCKCLN